MPALVPKTPVILGTNGTQTKASASVTWKTLRLPRRGALRGKLAGFGAEATRSSRSAALCEEEVRAGDGIQTPVPPTAFSALRLDNHDFL